MTLSQVLPDPGIPERERGARGASARPLRARRHVLGERLLQDALVRERRLADRLGPAFAVLVLDGGDNRPATLWSAVLRTVTDVARDIDVVGWLEQDAVLAVILPDTTAGGAFKIRQAVRREIARRLGDAALALSVRLYLHGGRSNAGDALPSVDLLVEGFATHGHAHWREVAKRGLDIVGSLLLLTIVAPVWLAILIVVKLTSPGPALFKQARVGRGGKPFTMLKFRTMHVSAADRIHRDYAAWFITSSGRQARTGNEVFKLTDDPRVTAVGWVLRKTSLDELPQFWNTLRGDMSLVGPRPPLPYEVEQYQPWHRRRVLDVKPGITGLWQVSGRSSTTFDEMVRLDLRYARTHSLWTDFRILAATPRAVVSGKGAW